MTDELNPPLHNHEGDHEGNKEAVPPIKVAFILDGKVLDILFTDERLASIFLSEPIIVEVTDNEDVTPGDDYDSSTGTFSHGPQTAIVVPQGR